MNANDFLNQRNFVSRPTLFLFCRDDAAKSNEPLTLMEIKDVLEKSLENFKAGDNTMSAEAILIRLYCRVEHALKVSTEPKDEHGSTSFEFK